MCENSHVKFSRPNVCSSNILCWTVGLIIFANDLFQDILSTSFGLETIPPFAPPNGKPAAAHFHVIVLASLKISVGVTVSANRIPPFPGLVDVLSITKTPLHTSIRIINLQDFFRPPFIYLFFLFQRGCHLLLSFYRYIIGYG
jgi:hypothetical protein